MIKILTNNKLHADFSAQSLQIASIHDINHTLTRFEEIYAEAIQLKQSANSSSAPRK